MMAHAEGKLHLPRKLFNGQECSSTKPGKKQKRIAGAHIPYDPCMIYVPTLFGLYIFLMVNV